MPTPALTNGFEFDSTVEWAERKCQPACKPGFVHASCPALDDHSSGTPVAGRFARPTRMTGPETALAPGSAVSSLFGLAPGGVCLDRRRCRKRGALLPHRFTLAGGANPAIAVSFLWHCPWGRPRRALPGTVFPWSPDFPPPHPFGPSGSGHPASWRATGRLENRSSQWKAMQRHGFCSCERCFT